MNNRVLLWIVVSLPWIAHAMSNRTKRKYVMEVTHRKKQKPLPEPPPYPTLHVDDIEPFTYVSFRELFSTKPTYLVALVEKHLFDAVAFLTYLKKTPQAQWRNPVTNQPLEKAKDVLYFQLPLNTIKQHEDYIALSASWLISRNPKLFHGFGPSLEKLISYRLRSKIYALHCTPDTLRTAPPLTQLTLFLYATTVEQQMAFYGLFEGNRVPSQLEDSQLLHDLNHIPPEEYNDFLSVARGALKENITEQELRMILNRFRRISRTLD